MDFFEQLRNRRAQLSRTLKVLGQATGIATSNLSHILAGNKDAQASTLQALADSLEARWILVPKHLIPEVERLLAGKAIGPDQVPSTVDRLFGGGANE